MLIIKTEKITTDLQNYSYTNLVRKCKCFRYTRSLFHFIHFVGVHRVAGTSAFIHFCIQRSASLYDGQLQLVTDSIWFVLLHVYIRVSYVKINKEIFILIMNKFDIRIDNRIIYIFLWCECHGVAYDVICL